MTDMDYKNRVVLAQSGRLDAFNDLVLHFQDMVFGYAYNRLHDFELAEDVTQEAFIEAYQRIASLRNPEAWPGWLRLIALKHCDRAWRQRGIRTQPLSAASETPADGLTPDELLIEQETHRLLCNALQSLTEVEQSVVTLFYIGTYRQRDIAVFLDISVDTVSNRLRSARAKLKGRMLKMAGNALGNRAPSKDRSLAEHVMMYNACRAGELHLVQELAAGDPSLVQSDHIQESPLAVAVRNGHLDVVEFLLDAGATPDQLRITGGYREATFGGGIMEIASARGFDEIVSLVRDTWKKAICD